MDMGHPLPDDPEVLAFIEQSIGFYPADAYTFTVEENRRWYDRYAAAFRPAERPEGVSAEDLAIPAEAPAREIPCRRYRPAGAAAGEALVLYTHGGGMVLGGLESHDDVCAGIAVETGLEVVAVDYRLAPEHLHPAQGDDVEAAFLHLAGEGRPIIVAGDSAGGNLTAALCLRLKARGGPIPAGQVLIYPGLGGDRTKGSYIENAEAPLLKAREGESYARLRTGGRDPAGIRDADLAPLLAEDVSGLPPALVTSADIDPLRDDARDWVERLRAAGVPALHRNEPQLVHGYLRARHMSRRAAESFAAICAAIREMADGRFRP